MHRVSKLKLAEVSPYMVCKLCQGYFIDPCTAQDCLHTFCKTCIVTHLYNNCTCPICGVVIHKTRPLEMIRHDQTMQDLVYKLVPGVFGKEMARRRQFYADHQEPDELNTFTNSEERGQVKDDREILTDDDSISMALIHSVHGHVKQAEPETENHSLSTTFLRCPANFTVSGLKKFVRAKYDLDSHLLIDIFHSDESLSDHYSLMDVAYIYTWRRRGPLQVFFTIYHFDPSSTEHQLCATNPSLSAANSKKRHATGSSFEMSESITITELIRNPIVEKSTKHDTSVESGTPKETGTSAETV